jgi:hypothetical protein
MSQHSWYNVQTMRHICRPCSLNYKVNILIIEYKEWYVPVTAIWSPLPTIQHHNQSNACSNQQKWSMSCCLDFNAYPSTFWYCCDQEMWSLLCNSYAGVYTLLASQLRIQKLVTVVGWSDWIAALNGRLISSQTEEPVSPQISSLPIYFNSPKIMSVTLVFLYIPKYHNTPPYSYLHIQ